MTIVTKPEELKAGKWYACGFGDERGEIQWGAAMIYQYHGDGYWTDDDGNEVESLYDPFLQLRVAMDAAEAYAQQG